MTEAIQNPWSILYSFAGTIYHIGPFAGEYEALTAARKAQEDGDFDILDTYVYLLNPAHQLRPLSVDDVLDEEEQDCCPQCGRNFHDYGQCRTTDDRLLCYECGRRANGLPVETEE